MNKILIVSAHPDDETLGCGGTILKHRSIGDEIHWLIMTNISIEEGYEKKRVEERQREIKIVRGRYGFRNLFKLNLPTAKLDMVPKKQMIETVSALLGKVRPNLIYLPNRGDVHTDHKVTFDVVSSATKTFRTPFVRKILIYEVISETEFSPTLLNSVFISNSFSDITKYLDKKISIMKIYKSEVGEHPFPRSAENIKALAIFRGATCGSRYAEAFMVLKEIW